ncbi:MAG: hypothetical protein B6U78_03030 [Candidatus Aenigmarchaeota archaeon ex4484_224]|nr:MAG: hypothetical protein B6U78_03030 [Candidatus Aenigmarchaeota archaeon ex4484_224]
MLELIFGLIILGIAIYFLIKIIKNIVTAILLIAIIFLFSYSFLHIQPQVPNLTGLIPYPFSSFINFLLSSFKSKILSLSIMSIDRDSSGRLLVVAKNEGILPLKNCYAKINNKTAEILNSNEFSPKETKILQIDWKNDFKIIEIICDKAKAIYEK